MIKLGRSIVIIGSYGVIQLLAFVAAGFAPSYLSTLPTFDIEVAPIILNVVASGLIYLAAMTLATLVKWILAANAPRRLRYGSSSYRKSSSFVSTFFFMLGYLGLLAIFSLLTWMLAQQYVISHAMWPTWQRNVIFMMHSPSLLLVSLDACFAVRNMYRH